MADFGGIFKGGSGDIFGPKRIATGSWTSALPPGATATAPVDPIAEAKAKTYANTEGRGQATLDDSYTNAALKRLEAIMSGADAPYDDATKSQMLSRQADMSAAAAGSQTQQLRDAAAASGGSAADPSFQAAQRAIDARRQQGNQATAGDIDTRARLANFDARNQAGRELTATRGNQLAHADTQFNQAAGYYSRTNQSGDHEAAFNYQPMGGSSQPAPGGEIGPSIYAGTTTGPSQGALYGARPGATAAPKASSWYTPPGAKAPGPYDAGGSLAPKQPSVSDWGMDPMASMFGPTPKTPAYKPVPYQF